MVNHISSMDLRMVDIVPVRHLKFIGQVLIHLFVYLRYFGLPIEFIVNIHHCERQEIALYGLVDSKSIEIIREKVFIHVFKVIVFRINIFSFRDLLGQLRHLFDHHVFNLLFVSLSEGC